MTTTLTKLAKPRTIRLTNGTYYTPNSNDLSKTERLPLIDVARIYSDNLEDRKAVAEEIREASRTIGFFYIVNHGIDMKQANAVLDQAKEFFAQPNEKKMEVCTDLIPEEFCGYHPMEHYNINGSARRDLHEAYNWNYSPAKDPDFPDSSLPEINLWPENMPEFQTTLCQYQTNMIRLARRMTRTFALALHMPEDYFDPHIIRPEAGLRILHYPEQTASRDDQNGIGAHTDVECFTIIACESEGLEVLSKSGDWIKAEPVPGAFVVNIADCFMRQTNDFFVSTIHRVINKTGRERYSVPFFWGLDRKMLMRPIPTCVGEANPQKYPEMTAGEYYAWRTTRQKKMWKEGDTS
ncbi:putative isopenicillin N synthetase [Elsinoe ampelina]|uniref:Putative isopenicillin N synthetase n=1 Tax=Elsinoe ampelina TaxID=302913 RepID=A0A6A6G1H0_9PEZI|nr:putative isopenicillin N synthetase [Elsinoe ampelina]